MNLSTGLAKFFRRKKAPCGRFLGGGGQWLVSRSVKSAAPYTAATECGSRFPCASVEIPSASGGGCRFTARAQNCSFTLGGIKNLFTRAQAVSKWCSKPCSYFYTRAQARFLNSGLSPEASHAPAAMRSSAAKYVGAGRSLSITSESTAEINGATA